MQYTMPQRSATAWATAAARRVVSGRLRAAMTGAQVHDDFDIPALALPDKVQRTCEAVLAQRSCIGDSKRRLGIARAAALGGGVCPFGCRAADGTSVLFTWAHAQFVCGECSIVRARERWVEEMEASVSCTTVDSAPHTQLTLVLAAARRGLPRTRTGRAHDAGLRRGEETLARRMVGGLVSTIGEGKDKNAEVRRQLTAAVTAGATVQQAAHEATHEAEEAAWRVAADMRKVQRWARRWRAAVGRAGPRRAAALREVKLAEALTAAHVLAAADGHAEQASMLEELMASGEPEGLDATSVVGCAMRAARAAERRLGGTAYWQWRLLALASRWRLRAAMRIRRWDGVEDPTGDEGELGGFAPSASGARVAMAEAGRMASYVMRRYVHVEMPVAQVREPERPAEADFADGWPPSMWLPTLSLVDKERLAADKWRRGGGWRGERKRRTEAARLSVARRAAHSRHLFEQYMRQCRGTEWEWAGRSQPQGRKVKCKAMAAALCWRQQFSTDEAALLRGRASFVGACWIDTRLGFFRPTADVEADGVGLSGLPLERGEAVLVEIAPRAKRRRLAAESAAAAAFGAGQGPDRGQRWRAESVLDVRRCRCAYLRRPWYEVQVRWAGANLAGEPWPDTWEPWTTDDGRPTMTGPLLDEARAVKRAKFAGGARGTPGATIAAASTEDTAARAATAARWAARWAGVKRARGGAPSGSAVARRPVATNVAVGVGPLGGPGQTAHKAQVRGPGADQNARAERGLQGEPGHDEPLGATQHLEGPGAAPVIAD